MWRGTKYHVELFFKEMFYGVLGKTKCYATCIERGSPYVHSFIWIFNALNIENEAAYIEFIKETISSQLPDDFSNSEFHELLKT